jgi:ribosomal protein S2
VDHQLYRQTIVEMEKQHVDAEYIQGWIGGFMGNLKREEQRLTEAYEKGYEDGKNQNTSNYESWIAS